MGVTGRQLAVAELEADVLAALDLVEAIRNRATMGGPEFEADVLAALDLVEAIRNRATMGGPAFTDYVGTAYQSLIKARFLVDEWKAGGDDAAV